MNTLQAKERTQIRDSDVQAGLQLCARRRIHEELVSLLTEALTDPENQIPAFNDRVRRILANVGLRNRIMIDDIELLEKIIEEQFSWRSQKK